MLGLGCVSLVAYLPVMACPACTSIDQPSMTQALMGLLSYRHESSKDGSICCTHRGSRSCSLTPVMGSI